MQVGSIRHYGQGAVADFVAHVNLSADTVENLRQRLVDGIYRHRSLNAGLDVEVDFCVTRQREQDLLSRYIGDHYAISGDFTGGFRGRQHDGIPDRLRDAGFCFQRSSWLLNMLSSRFDWFRSATGQHHTYSTEIHCVA